MTKSFIIGSEVIPAHSIFMIRGPRRGDSTGSWEIVLNNTRSYRLDTRNGNEYESDLHKKNRDIISAALGCVDQNPYRIDPDFYKTKSIIEYEKANSLNSNSGSLAGLRKEA